MKKQKAIMPRWLIFLIIIVLFIALIVYIASLGKVDIGAGEPFPEEFKENRADSAKRHKKLSVLLEKQKELKTRLARKFRIIYFGVRISFVVAWIGLIGLIYSFGYIKDLEDILNYSEASLLIMFTFNFLCFGSVTNLQRIIQLIKTRLENWIYGKHIDGGVLKTKSLN